MQLKLARILELSLIVLLIAGAIWLLHWIGIDQVRSQIARFGIWAPLIILLLRLASIVIPVVPGTPFALLAGGLLGFGKGLLVIVIADFLGCTANFWIARRYGRSVVHRIVGERLMARLDHWGQKYLESNFFLLAGALMSSFFDYVCYAIGLSQISQRRFWAALGLSLVIVKPIVVGVGAGFVQGDKLLVGTLILGMFGLAIVSAWLRRREARASESS